MQSRKIKRKLIYQSESSIKDKFAFDYSDLHSNTIFMQPGLIFVLEPCVCVGMPIAPVPTCTLGVCMALFILATKLDFSGVSPDFDSSNECESREIKSVLGSELVLSVIVKSCVLIWYDMCVYISR